MASGAHRNPNHPASGNAETDNLDDGAATMEAVYFGNAKGGLNHGGAGKGPWIMADMEQALWGADVVKSNEEPIEHEFVTAMIKGDSGDAPGHWAIKGGDAQAGELKVYWDGKRAPRYAPMKKQGAIILGIGGDNSDGAVGTFYEAIPHPLPSPPISSHLLLSPPPIDLIPSDALQSSPTIPSHNPLQSPPISADLLQPRSSLAYI